MQKSFIESLEISFEEMMNQEIADLSFFASDEEEILVEEEEEVLEPIF